MNPTKLRFLAITAHPDDETGSFGGTLALYAARGVAIEVVCATRGEAGRNRGSARTREELAEMRSREFLQACERHCQVNASRAETAPIYGQLTNL